MNEKIESGAGIKIDVVINLLRLGLHVDLELLKSEVYKNVREMAKFSTGSLFSMEPAVMFWEDWKEILQTLNALFFSLKTAPEKSLKIASVQPLEEMMHMQGPCLNAGAKVLFT